MTSTISGIRARQEGVQMKAWLKGSILVATMLLLFSQALPAEDPHSSFSRAPVRKIAMTPEGRDPIPFTAATLRRFDSGLSMTLVSAVPVAAGTQAGYTVWWVVFNKPQNCTHPLSDSNGVISACSMPDFAAAEASVFNASGSVVVGFTDGTNTGLLSVNGQAGLGPDGIPGQTQDPPNNQILEPGGVTNPKGAEVHLVIRNHGALDGVNDFLEVAASQTTGSPAVPGQAQNIQFAVFQP
ncbi:MAG: hypothetical protein ACRDFW_07480 [bacterium]